jgi:peptidoglycan/LPS O-acetylase OafA/YrhL
VSKCDVFANTVSSAPNSNRPPAGARNLQLDVLRCVAVFLVIGAHIAIDNHEGVTGWLARWWHANGWLGVPIFFTLSGYLISGLIFDELRVRGDFRVGRFLIRRGFKLYPAYYVFLAYLIIVPWLKSLLSGRDALGSLASSLRDLWPNFLFLQNYIGPNPALHTWSLAVEEHFYLILPFLMLWLHRRGWIRGLTVIGLGSPLIFEVIRFGCRYAGDPYAAMPGMFATHLRLDGLGVGVGLRALQEYSPAVFQALGRWRWLWIGLATVLLLSNPIRYFPMTPMGSALLLLGSLHVRSIDFGPIGRVGMPVAQLAAGIGVYSYSIYLWHVTLLGIGSKYVFSILHLDTTQPGQWLLNRSLIVMFIIGGGCIMSRIVEWPLLRIRDRYFPRRT